MLAATMDPSIDPGERLIDIARQIEANESDLSRVWPGYWPANQPFVLYLPEEGAVFAGAAVAGAPEFRPGPLPDASFTYALDYPSGVPNTVLMRFDDFDSLDDDLTVLFHEQFHDFQSDAFRWIGHGADEFVDLSGIADLETFTVEAEGERRLLSQALGASDPGERRRLVRQYLTARETRLAALSSNIRTAEDHREWTEGTAEYAGLVAMTTVNPNGAGVPERLRKALDTPLFAHWGSYLSAVFRGRAYGVGATQAWLLDDFAVPDWQQKIERGARMTVLLDEALTAAGVTTAPPPPPIEQAVRDDVLRQMAALNVEPADRAAFLATQAHWLMLEVIVPAARFSELTLHFGADHMSPLPDGAIALPQAREVEVALGDFRVEVRGRPVLIDPGSDGTRIALAIALTDEAEVARLTTPGADAPEGVTLRLPAGVTPSFEAGQVVIRVAP